MQSKAKSVKEYLAELPAERKTVLEKVRHIILKKLPKGYEETMQYGMITYVVPLALYPKGYLDRKDEPLPYVSLAAQKNNFAVYFMSLYGESDLLEWFVSEYKKTGKKLDMGKSCLRFKTLDSLPLELVGQAVAKVSVKKFVEIYEKNRQTKKK